MEGAPFGFRLQGVQELRLYLLGIQELRFCLWEVQELGFHFQCVF